MMRDIRTILFDVDNTLYEPRCGVEQEMGRRIDRLVSDLLEVSPEEAIRLRRENLPVYGTTLRWLQVCHGLTDTDRYMALVHPENLEDFVSPSRELREMLLSLPQKLVIFTNGPEFHARRVLNTLGVEDLFPWFYSLEHLGFKGKPYRNGYELILREMDIRAEETLFLDDKEINLDTFHAMGGHGILVSSSAGSGRYPVIPTVLGLKDHLEDLKERQDAEVYA